MTETAGHRPDSPAGSVTVVGTGAIGRAVATTLLAAGRPVMVWNRTATRARELVDAGAVAARSLQDAVTASALTLVTLKDYEAVDAVLAQLDGDLSGRSLAVLSTGTPADARQAHERVEQLGADYLDAGVQTSPEDIGTDAATILYSGSRGAFERHRSTLELLSTPRFVSEDPQAAALWDLTLFGVWYDAQLGLLRALETVQAAGIDLDEFAETAATQLGHVVHGAAATAAELRDADFPRGPADLDEHLVVVRQLVEMRSASGLGDGGLGQVGRVIDSLVADGRGSQGLTAVAARAAR